MTRPNPRDVLAELFGGDEPYNLADRVINVLRRSGWDITEFKERRRPGENAVLFLALHHQGWGTHMDPDEVADALVADVNDRVDEPVTIDGMFAPQWMTTEGQIRLLAALRAAEGDAADQGSREIPNYPQGGDTAHNGHVAWSAMCGDRVVVNGWTGRVVAQHGPYSWVSMEATNSPQTHATSQLVQWPDPPQPTPHG